MASVPVPQQTVPPSLHALASDYSAFLDFPDLTAKNLHTVEDALLKSLSRLDELGALIEMARVDTLRLKDEVLPLINERANELRKLFILIERLRTLADGIRRSMEEMEVQIAADEERVSLVTLKKVMNVFAAVPSLFGGKKPLPPPTEHKAIEIIDTAAFFKKLREDLQMPRPSAPGK